MDDRSKEKRERLDAALADGVATIHLDARRPGVKLPEHLRTDPNLRLNLSLRFDPPDLATGDWGVHETLSFSGTSFRVAVPWQAIFAVTGGGARPQAWLFPEDMPEELFDAAADRFGLSEKEVDDLKREASKTASMGLAPPDPSLTKRPFVPRVVEAAEAPAPMPPTTQGPNKPDGTSARRSHLRVVK